MLTMNIIDSCSKYLVFNLEFSQSLNNWFDLEIHMNQKFVGACLS
jgi:hypothetical protein